MKPAIETTTTRTETTETVEISLLDAAVAATMESIAATAANARRTAAVRTPVATPAYTAPTVTRARAGLAPTPKQWAMARHLRNQLRKLRTDAADALAGRQVISCRRAVSLYIGEMQAALRAAYTPKTGAAPKTGGEICCCRVPGCRIGPMVPCA